MYFILSKTAGLLLNPLVILLVLLIPGLLLKKPVLKGSLLGLFLLLFFVFSNPFITNEVLLRWETPAVTYSQLESNYDVAIVLSGVTASDKGPNDRVHLYKGADRIMHAVQLYKLGKVQQLLLSGGSGSLRGNSISEAERMKRVMLLSGVPEDDILLEEASRNTYENAAFSKTLLETQHPNGRYLLVSSAFHLPRALACFEKQGITADPFSTDFYSFDPPYAPEHFMIPDSEAIFAWSRLLKEWFGLLSYKIMGYL